MNGPVPPPASSGGLLSAFLFRRALLSFFLSGVLFSFLGAILPLWGHHLRGEFGLVGVYFLALIAGLLLSLALVRLVLGPRRLKILLVVGSALAAAGLFALSAVPLSISSLWRLPGLLLIGLGGGLLNAGAIRAIFPTFQYAQWSTVNLAGAVHALGCVLTVWLVRNTIFVYTTFAIFFFLALVPVFWAIMFQTSRLPDASTAPSGFGEAWRMFRSPSSVLFVLLILIQFSNEYTVAGWLPIYLIQRLGVSPEIALNLLALFWLTLLLGRILAQGLMRALPHGRLLLGALGAAILGCLILINTNNVFGASTGILLLGSSFAVIYPLVVEKIEGRFPAHHPEFFQNMFTFGLAAGLMGPALAGLLVANNDIGWIMVIPLAGTILVFVLVAILWLEARLTAPTPFREHTE